MYKVYFEEKMKPSATNHLENTLRSRGILAGNQTVCSDSACHSYIMKESTEANVQMA